MADGEQLSTQDLQDLAEIRKQLPVGHPMYGKIGALVQAHSEQPTQYEKSINSTEGKGFASGVKESLGGVPESPMKAGLGLGIPAIGAAKGIWDTIKNSPENYKAGGIPGVLGPLVGIDPQSMRARAERGDTGGVLGEAAIPTAMAISPFASKAAGKVLPEWKTIRNVAGDAAGKYVGHTLADKLRAPELPTPPPQLSLPSTSSLSTMPSATTGTALRPPVGVGSTTSTSGMPIHFGELPPAPKPVDPVAQAVKLRTASWIPTKMPDAAVPPAPLGSPENPGWHSKVPSTMPQLPEPLMPKPELGTPENPGWLAKLSTRMPKPSTDLAVREPGERPGARTSPDDLISRTRAIVRPGEQPSPEDLKRAGDLTQAPLSRLKELAKFNDKLAQNEINRRLRNQ